jgi:hypothetical protein
MHGEAVDMADLALYASNWSDRPIIAGIALLAGSPGALHWLVPGFVFSFLAAGFSAWILLVEIQR